MSNLALLLLALRIGTVLDGVRVVARLLALGTLVVAQHRAHDLAERVLERMRHVDLLAFAVLLAEAALVQLAGGAAAAAAAVAAATAEAGAALLLLDERARLGELDRIDVIAACGQRALWRRRGLLLLSASIVRVNVESIARTCGRRLFRSSLLVATALSVFLFAIADAGVVVVVVVVVDLSEKTIALLAIT